MKHVFVKGYLGSLNMFKVMYKIFFILIILFIDSFFNI